MKVFGNDLADSKAYGNDVVKIIAYGETVWEKQTSIPDYLCFTALESGTFTLTIPAAVTTSNLSYVEYSLDGRNWVKTDNSSSDVTITTPTIAANGKVYWRGSGTRMTQSTTAPASSTKFSSTGNFNVSGHLLSLLKGDDFDGVTGVNNYTFCNLFYNCTTVVNAEDLVMPSFTSSFTRIFYQMFYGCTSLETAPALPSTNLAEYCYYGMFQNCTSLLAAPNMHNITNLAVYCCAQMYFGCTALTSGTVPQATTLYSNCFNSMYRDCDSLTETDTLPATALVESCYRYMYYGCDALTTVETISATSATGTNNMNQMFRLCSNLVTLPPLLITTLTEACYYQMLQNCAKLNYVKCLATDLSATNCLSNWLSGVSSTGTFIQAEGVTWPSGASGIPSTWVTIEKRTMPSGYKQVEYVENPNYAYIKVARAFNSNSETLELAFVKQDGGSNMPFGNSTYNYRYGSLKVIEQSTALLIRVGVDYDDQVQKDSQITSVTADKPYTLRYVGDSSGFQLYLNGTLKKTETCAWDAVDPFDANFLFSSTTNAASTVYFHTKPIYYLKIWNSNNVLAVDYVPCVRTSDSKVGFYDFANSAFVVSTNSNNFTAGAEI